MQAEDRTYQISTKHPQFSKRAKASNLNDANCGRTPTFEEADRIVIIGCNPRYEAPLVNARIRKAWLHAETEVDVIGSEVNLSYTYNYHGNDPQSEYKLKIQSKTDLFSFDTNCKWYTQSR